MMNKFQFKLHRKIFGDREIDPGILDYLYNNYSENNRRLELQSSLSEEEFKSVCSIIYSVLSLRISDSDYLFVINRFMLLLIKDQLEGEIVNINWIIDHVAYLSTGVGDTCIQNYKYKQSLEIVKDCLIERFDLGAVKKKKN